MNNGDARQSTLGDEVFDRVLGSIYRGEIAPGSIINESALAAQYGVSRGPVREAIRRLQGIQLVTREAFSKARVVDLTPNALVELFQMREALEGFACRLAAREMGADEVDALASELDAAGRPGGTRAFDFHERIGRWPDAPKGRTRREIVALRKGLPVYRGSGPAKPGLSEDDAVGLAEALPPPTFDAGRRLRELDRLA